MRRLSLFRDQRGASALEFALMAPVFFSVLIGAAQMGILFFANTGLQHAVGEGARVAMIFPRPSTETIRQAVKDARYGLDPAYLVGEPVVTIDETGDPDFAEISWSYNAPLNFIFYQTPAVTLEHKRKVFLQAPAAGGGGGGGGGTTTGGSTSTGGSSSTGGTTTGGTTSTSAGGTTSGGTTTSGGDSTTSSTSSTSGGTTTTSGGTTTSTSSTSTSSTSSGSDDGDSNNGSSGNGKGSDQAKGNGKK